MTIKNFELPDIGEGVAEGEIVSWKVAVGDKVVEEQDFVEIMTDKATVTITVPWDGVIQELRAKEGDVVPVETVIAVIDTDVAVGGSGNGSVPPIETPVASASPTGTATATRAPAVAAVAARSTPGRVLAAPATRRRAREAGVDLARVTGTGPNARVTNEDLDRFLAGGTPSTPTQAVASPGFAPVAVAAAPTAALSALEERIPFRGVRKKIADAMTRSKSTAAHFTV